MNQRPMDQEILRQKLRHAADRFIKSTAREDDVDAIVLTGSLIYGDVSKYSDVDIYVLLTQDTNYCERGNILIDEVEIEYFKNPPLQIRNYFKSEIKSPHTAHMITQGELVYNQSTIIHELIQEAQAILDKGRPRPTDTEIELYKYGLDDIYKDLLGCIEKGDRLVYPILVSDLVKKIVEIQYHLDGRFTPKVNWYEENLGSDYPGLFNLVQRALRTTINSNSELENLVSFSHHHLGGQRSTPWKLRAKITTTNT